MYEVTRQQAYREPRNHYCKQKLPWKTLIPVNKNYVPNSCALRAVCSVIVWDCDMRRKFDYAAYCITYFPVIRATVMLSNFKKYTYIIYAQRSTGTERWAGLAKKERSGNRARNWIDAWAGTDRAMRRLSKIINFPNPWMLTWGEHFHPTGNTSMAVFYCSGYVLRALVHLFVNDICIFFYIFG